MCSWQHTAEIAVETHVAPLCAGADHARSQNGAGSSRRVNRCNLHRAVGIAGWKTADDPAFDRARTGAPQSCPLASKP